MTKVGTWWSEEDSYDVWLTEEKGLYFLGIEHTRTSNAAEMLMTLASKRYDISPLRDKVTRADLTTAQVAEIQQYYPDLWYLLTPEEAKFAEQLKTVNAMRNIGVLQIEAAKYGYKLVKADEC